MHIRFPVPLSIITFIYFLSLKYQTHKTLFSGSEVVAHIQADRCRSFSTYSITSRPGSSVSIATDYGLDGPGSNPGGDEILCLSRPALGPTQPPVKWVRGISREYKCSQGVLLTTHPLLVPRSWKSRVIPLPTLWATPGL